MIWLLLALSAVGILVWLGRRSASRKGEWRVASGVLATAAAVGAIIVGMRGGWIFSIGLLVLAAWLSLVAKRGIVMPMPGGMSETRARSILGVGPEATSDEVQAAYVRLMRSVHPDKGGSTGLAAELNAARDRLVGKSK